MRLELAARYAELCRQYPYNPHGSTCFAEQSRRLILGAEQDILQSLGIAEGSARVVWCSGATEALNLAIFSALKAQAGCRVYYDPAAHAAMLEPLLQGLPERTKRAALPLGRTGELLLAGSPQAEPGLVCVCHVNNESGAVQDLYALRAHFGPQSILCVDAAQSPGKLDIPWDTAGIDYLALSSRKLGGPASIGALLYRPGAPLASVYYGGGQQAGLRSGTLDAVSIYLFAQALKLACRDRDQEYKRIAQLNIELRRGLADISTGSWPIFSALSAVPHILYFAIPGHEGAIMARILAAEYGILVGTGSACSAESKKSSHVLKAMLVPDELARCAIRLSLGYGSKPEDIKALLEAIPRVLQQY